MLEVTWLINKEMLLTSKEAKYSRSLYSIRMAKFHRSSKLDNWNKILAQACRGWWLRLREARMSHLTNDKDTFTVVIHLIAKWETTTSGRLFLTRMITANTVVTKMVAAMQKPRKTSSPQSLYWSQPSGRRAWLGPTEGKLLDRSRDPALNMRRTAWKTARNSESMLKKNQPSAHICPV